MLGGWWEEKGTRLPDVKRKRAWRKEYDAINRMRQKKNRKKRGGGGGKRGTKREETELKMMQEK